MGIKSQIDTDISEVKKSFTKMIQYPTYDERLRYLYIGGGIGDVTFGFDRWMNQRLYRSKEWRELRNAIILRDDGCDLGCKDRPIFDKIIIHHIIPITYDDICNRAALVLDPDNLVCVSMDTHNYIHYGDTRDQNGLKELTGERFEGDTCPWRVV